MGARTITDETKETVRQQYRQGYAKVKIALDNDICIGSVERILKGCTRDSILIKTPKEQSFRAIQEEDIDETKLVRVKDERRVRPVLVNGKVMYGVFYFMFGW